MNGKLKWWEDSVDEILSIMAVAGLGVVAILYLGKEGVPVVTAVVSVVGTYIGSRGRSRSNGNGG